MIAGKAPISEKKRDGAKAGWCVIAPGMTTGGTGPDAAAAAAACSAVGRPSAAALGKTCVRAAALAAVGAVNVARCQPSEPARSTGAR